MNNPIELMPVGKMAEAMLSATRPSTNQGSWSMLLLTRVMENNLFVLEGLRAKIDIEGRKQIDDVRTVADITVKALLSGIETRIDYSDLLDLIDQFRAGLAQRHVALNTR